MGAIFLDCIRRKDSRSIQWKRWFVNRYRDPLPAHVDSACADLHQILYFRLHLLDLLLDHLLLTSKRTVVWLDHFLSGPLSHNNTTYRVICRVENPISQCNFMDLTTQKITFWYLFYLY
jgi:hypothetical protein